jgi:DNA-binding NarL/FixJ family response regulator
MRVLLVDDHTVVRQALRTMLESEPDISIVGEAANGQEAVELTRDLQPEIVLMDISMPEMNGIEATRFIHADAPAICVIGLSMFTHDQQGEAMQDAGAMDYVTKSAPPAVLLTVMRGCYARSRKELPPAAAE